ncbi:uncharacterized protein F5147DRAFT_657345 [Suillus discolor]|uniref:Uncharacterized protein n=1 Tax=Suillus discolor TaxID=1912936 RepID=A0A9P7EWW2_9AGAM|nr:uncharacterized protein F5147DRAFT_657345 [Suillus discolor]KAG2093723.1 hypothetical protein F5147DRAFT_657345 [Suillus discolor]
MSWRGWKTGARVGMGRYVKDNLNVVSLWKRKLKIQRGFEKVKVTSLIGLTVSKQLRKLSPEDGARITLHAAHLAHALGDTERAGVCYRVAKSVDDETNAGTGYVGAAACAGTVHLIVGIIRLEYGLVKYGNTFHDGPARFFADVTQQTFVTKNTIITLQTLLGDGVVVICNPFGICMVYVQAPTTNAKNVFGNQTGHWITVFLSLTLATNLLSSGLLAYHIWTIERNVSGTYATNNDMPILQIIPIISIAFYMVFICVAISKKIHECLSATLC